MKSPCPLHELLGQQENLAVMDYQAALFWSPDIYLPLLAILKWGNLLEEDFKEGNRNSFRNGVNLTPNKSLL